MVALAKECGQPAGAAVDALGDGARDARNAIVDALSDDMNVPRALGLMWAFVKDDSIPAADRLGVVLDLDKVLGLELAEVAATSNCVFFCQAA